jgi:CRP/FNR family transcriptional regulator, dissimilatory nitrate respiration regulator
VSVEDRLTLVSQVKLFRPLGRECLIRLAEASRVRWIEPGETVFRQGDDARGLYVVMSGRVMVYKVSPEGREQVLKVWESGEHFGEVALFGGKDYPANAQALEGGHLLYVSRRGLLQQIGEYPELGLALLGALSVRLRHLVGLVEDLSLKEVPCRLAAYLLDLSGRQGGAAEFELDVAKGRLATMLGTLPETVSRVLKKMYREKLVETSGPRGLTILDADRLQDLADGHWKLR